LLEEWEECSIECEEEKGSSRYRAQEGKKGSTGIRQEVPTNHMWMSGVSPDNR
jgi:hypothetical protein